MCSSQSFRPELLKTTRAVWDFLPDVIQEQLLMDRESTGYIQVGLSHGPSMLSA